MSEEISLNDLSDLAIAMKDSERKVKEVDAELKRVKEAARVLREETMPGAMQELGFTEIKLDSGEKINIKQDVYASIPISGKDQAHAWLEDNGFGGLIKIDVIAKYSKDESDIAIALVRELAERGLQVSLKKGVNAQTLKAFLREQVSIGAKPPLELFGARTVWVAKIK